MYRGRGWVLVVNEGPEVGGSVTEGLEVTGLIGEGNGFCFDDEGLELLS